MILGAILDARSDSTDLFAVFNDHLLPSDVGHLVRSHENHTLRTCAEDCQDWRRPVLYDSPITNRALSANPLSPRI